MQTKPKCFVVSMCYVLGGGNISSNTIGYNISIGI